MWDTQNVTVSPLCPGLWQSYGVATMCHFLCLSHSVWTHTMFHLSITHRIFVCVCVCVYIVVYGNHMGWQPRVTFYVCLIVCEHIQCFAGLSHMESSCVCVCVCLSLCMAITWGDNHVSPNLIRRCHRSGNDMSMCKSRGVSTMFLDT